MTTQNNVFIMKNNSSLQKVGKIDEEKSKIHIENINITSVDNFNKQVLEFIEKDDSIIQEQFHFIKSEDILGVIFYVLRWRGCTGYLVVQKSDRGVRYLCYLYDKIKHHASSFGTTIDLVKKEFVIEELKKAKIELMNKLINYDELIQIKNAIITNGSDIEKSFGI